MKFKKVLSATMIAAMAAVSFAGCGSSSNSDEFVIGGIGPTTGDAASYGTSVKNGAQIAVDEINNAGGVKIGDETKKLKLNFQDDANDAETAKNAFNKLMDDKMGALLGCVTSTPCIAVTSLSRDAKILQITPSGSQKECAQYDNCFRVCFTDPQQGDAMADYIVSKLGKKKVAVLYANSSSYSQGIKDAFDAKVKELGGEIVVEEAFAEKDVDYNTQLSKIKSSDAEAVFVPAYYQEVSYIVKQANEKGITLPFFGSDGWDGILDQVSDKKVVEGATFLSPFLSTDEDAKVQAFTKAYKAAYGDANPDQFAADGYDTVYTIKAALEKAGSTDIEKLQEAMTQISVEGVTGNMTFDKSGDATKSTKLIQIKDGKYTAIAVK
ncbi:MAG: ABC transporter substrate-binding protein [bacterium]|nr:ABC transporter substrate-binding protein [bacterium]